MPRRIGLAPAFSAKIESFEFGFSEFPAVLPSRESRSAAAKRQPMRSQHYHHPGSLPSAVSRSLLQLATMSPHAKPAAAKPKTAAAGPSHPPYFEMIKEAIAALKDRTGSSSVAIAKYIDEKHGKSLPANFKKMLSVQLRGSAAKGKLVKVKASYKLSDAAKKDSPKAKAVVKPAKAAAKPKKKDAAKPKKKDAAKTKNDAVKPKKKAVAAGTKRKAPEKKLIAKAKKSPAAKAKAKPKTVKSPAAKKARKVAAA